MAQQSGTASVLAAGVWVKIAVTETGVYRIDQPALAKLNPAFATATPTLLRLYGNGGQALPQANAAPRPADLLENAIEVSGAADGRFDAADAVVFWGQGPQTVVYDSLTRHYTHHLNPYTDTTFYYLTIGTQPGLRIGTRPAGTPAAVADATTFTDYQFHEDESLKLPSVRSGREWLGEYLTLDTTRTFTFSVPGRVPQSPIWVRLSAVAGATVPTQFNLSANTQRVGVLPVAAISGYEYDYQAISKADTFAFTLLDAKAEAIRLTVGFQKNGQATAQGYLNYVGLETHRTLRAYDNWTWAHRVAAGTVGVAQPADGLRVWDVSDPLHPVEQLGLRIGTTEVRWQAAKMADYALFTSTQIRSGLKLQVVENQNLSGKETPTLLIITAPLWLAEAQRLATYRQQHDSLSVGVITTTQVYNEFGSGQPDPTALRDAIRYFFRKNPNRLRYVLLFGDATYDYRNHAHLLSDADLANIVPVYESRESFHPVLSYSSDDYYGFMGDAEGEWPENVQGDYALQLGIGRLPVKSVAEAKAVVDKLLRYNANKGDWQTRMTVIADDGDFNTHQRDANQLAMQVETKFPAYRVERLFLDSYPQQVTPDGQRAPIIEQRIAQAMKEGRLIINYSGHGGVSGLADEQIITDGDIVTWQNTRLPLFVTATCQFGRYDDPTVNSGAELALLNPNGGGIALLTTTRPVYANTNLLINTAFYDAVFQPDSAGQMPRLGDVMMKTKNNSLSGPLNRNFTLLGDPSMQLAYPKANIVLTEVNGYTLAAGEKRTDTVRAQATVRLAGEIRLKAKPQHAFTGTVWLTLFDKPSTLQTLGTESVPMTYKAFTNVLYAGKVAVQQGRFAVQFVLPKDIDYSIGAGRLMAYALQTDSTMEALGSYDGLLIGGSQPADSVDKQPPTVRVIIAGATQQGNTYQLNASNIPLTIHVSDNVGITISQAGIGHAITAELSGYPAITLTDKFVITSADGRQGEAAYTFAGVKPGSYTLRVKAWDVSNNSAEATLSLTVLPPPALAIQAVLAYPNPATDAVQFLINHNRMGDTLTWRVEVYDLAGRLHSQQAGSCTDCPEPLHTGSWALTQPPGLYVYRVHVQSVSDQTIGTQRGQLLIKP